MHLTLFNPHHPHNIDRQNEKMNSGPESGATGLLSPDWDPAGTSSLDSISLTPAFDLLFGSPEPLFMAAAAMATPEIQRLLDPNNAYDEPEGPETTWEELVERGEAWFCRKFRFKPE